jgi:hypothetical protein
MAHHDKATHTVTVEDLAVFTAFELEALIALLERRGILTHVEVLEEIVGQNLGGARGG